MFKFELNTEKSPKIAKEPQMCIVFCANPSQKRHISPRDMNTVTVINANVYCIQNNVLRKAFQKEQEGKQAICERQGKQQEF